MTSETKSDLVIVAAIGGALVVLWWMNSQSAATPSQPGGTLIPIGTTASGSPIYTDPTSGGSLSTVPATTTPISVGGNTTTIGGNTTVSPTINSSCGCGCQSLPGQSQYVVGGSDDLADDILSGSGAIAASTDPIYDVSAQMPYATGTYITSTL